MKRRKRWSEILADEERAVEATYCDKPSDKFDPAVYGETMSDEWIVLAGLKMQTSNMNSGLLTARHI